MASDENQHVAGAWIGDRNTGIGRTADRDRHTRHHLEWNALLVQEQRFLAAAVEDERIAPLQTHDSLAFTRFLDQQQADGILFQRFRGSRANVDAFGAGLRQAQQASMHAMVVNHDIRRLQKPAPAHGDERRVAGAGADDEYARLFHGYFRSSTELSARRIVSRMSRAPSLINASATRRPSIAASDAGPCSDRAMTRDPSGAATMARTCN